MIERINGMPVVAVCERCGRKFLSMPKDGIDHYGRITVRRAGTDRVFCGGRVIPVADASATTESAK